MVLDFLRRPAPESDSAVAELKDEVQRAGWQESFLLERIAELELGLEDAGWDRLNADGDVEFSRRGLRLITRLSRLAYLKNPLINRAVQLQTNYVWAQGITIAAKDEALNDVVQAFLDDEANRAELTSHQSRTLKEVDLQVEGNLFFVLFTNPASGQVRVRSIPFDEVEDVITDPEDAKRPWYYRRAWMQRAIGADGRMSEARRVEAYYPDWRFKPSAKLPAIDGKEVKWDAPVYHVRVGGLSNMRFGVPETYQALDWAKAYKEFLEDWHTIVKALSRFAMKLTLKDGGARAVTSAKTRMNTTFASSGSSPETNPPPGVGSTFVGTQGVALDVVNTSGARPQAEDARRSLLMVAAAMGWPETFFGDANVGNHATAKTLDRPTELKIRDRQALWADVLRGILNYVLENAVRANVLPGEVIDGEDGRSLVQFGAEIDPALVIDFPDILEHDVLEQVQAITEAATAGGKAMARTLPPKTVTYLLLTTLGVENVDEIMETLYPDGEGETFPEEPEPADDPELAKTAADAMVEAARALTEAVSGGVEVGA